MAKKKTATATKEDAVQPTEGDVEDEVEEDDNSPEAYQTTGDFVVDFTELCKRGDVNLVNVKSRPQTPAQLGAEGEGPNTYVTKDKYEYLKPCIEVENDEDNKVSIKSLFIKGWAVDVPMLNILNLAAPQSLTHISLWRCGLDSASITGLVSMLSKLQVRVLLLDGNPSAASSFHHLCTEDSTLTNLSLRSNQINCNDASQLALALANNKTITNLSLYNNHIGDQGAMDIAKALRMNRSLLSLNLSSNKISDAGAKSVAEILTSLTLTHEEVVARRKLISENKSSLLVDDHFLQISPQPPTTPGGRSKDRPGSNSRTGSHTALDKNKNKGASGKGKKQDKLQQPPAKDGRKSEQGKKDDKKRGAGSSSDSKSKAKSKGPAGKKGTGGDEKEQEPEIVEFQNPLLESNESEIDGVIVVSGNYALTSLNLNNNLISNSGITSLYKAIQFQENRQMKRGVRGLLRLTTKMNKYDTENRYATELLDVMVRRDPFYEHPLLEEDQSNATTNT